MSLPSLLIDLMSGRGLPPVRYSQRLLQPSLSESVLATFGSNGSKPYCCFQLLGMPSPTALKFGSRLVVVAETVPPALTSRPQALVMTRLSMTNVPALTVSVPLRTSRTALPVALVTKSAPPATRTVPVAVQAPSPTMRLDNTVLV